MNVITELIIGYMQPGRPVAMMLFKSWGYMMSYNGLSYVADMKIGELFIGFEQLCTTCLHSEGQQLS